jgi:16S rRNA (guanine966-N2)-methyltransferase
MRILGGRWAGRSLLSPSGRIRPTAEATRQALVILLGDRIPGARILDLFAGTGSVGIELLSHGARSVDFVEDDPSALHSLKGNVRGLRLPKERTRVFIRDAIPFAEALGPTPPPPPEASGEGTRSETRPAYTGVFADPPWGSKKLDRILLHWLANPFSHWLLLEHADNVPLPESPLLEAFPGVVTTRKVGDARLTLWDRSP